MRARGVKQSTSWSTTRPPTRRAIMGCVLLVAGLAACDDDEPIGIRRGPEPRVLALAELTFSGIGLPDMNVNVEGAADVGVFEVIATGRLDLPKIAEPRRFVHASFRVRDALDPAILADTVDALRLVLAATDGTIGGTSIGRFELPDGTRAPAALAALVRAAGLPRINSDGTVSEETEGILRQLSDSELGTIELPDGVVALFPSAFIVRVADEAPGERLDAIANFGFSLPLLARAQDNPRTLSVLLLAVEPAR